MRRMEEGSSHYYYWLLWNLLDLVVHLEKGGLMTVIAVMTMTLLVVVVVVVVASAAAVVGLPGSIAAKVKRISYLKFFLETVERHRIDCCHCRQMRRDCLEVSSLLECLLLSRLC